MRIETIVGPAILGIAIAAWPGVAPAVQILGIVLAVAPALALGARVRGERLRRSAGPGEAAERARVPRAAERPEP